MTSAQRYWLSGFLLVFAFVLAVYHLEWARYENEPLERPPNDRGQLALPWAPWEVPEFSRPARLIFTFSEELPKSENESAHSEKAGPSLGSVTGIYARRDNVTEAAIFGIFLPLVLIGASGFIALGKWRAGQ